MAKSITVQNVKDEVEHVLGRQPENYLLRLINDALLDISSKKQHYVVSSKIDLTKKQRWYALTDDMIDVLRVEILDSNSRYVRIPKLSDPQNILRADSDVDADSLT